jgi:hypothetical protein
MTMGVLLQVSQVVGSLLVAVMIAFVIAPLSKIAERIGKIEARLAFLEGVLTTRDPKDGPERRRRPSIG